MITLHFLAFTCSHHLDCGQYLCWASFPLWAGSHRDVHSIWSLSSSYTDHCCVLFVLISGIFQSGMALSASLRGLGVHLPRYRNSLRLVSHSVGSLGIKGILPLNILLGAWVSGRIHSSQATLRHAETQTLFCITLEWGNAAALSCLHLPCHLICSGILQPSWLYLGKGYIYPQACVGLLAFPLLFPHSQRRRLGCRTHC